MAATPYKYYRVLISKTRSDPYCSLNTVRLYEGASTSSTDVAQGSIATASSTYSSGTEPANVLSSSSNWWSSKVHTSAEGKLPQWVQLELPSPKVVRAFAISCTVAAGEAPVDFKIQASHDATTWIDIYEETGNTTELTITRYLSISVSGISKLDSGDRSVAVLIRDWETGILLNKIKPNNDGSWRFGMASVIPVLITHIGPSGFKPISDGPVIPYSW